MFRKKPPIFLHVWELDTAGSGKITITIEQREEAADNAGAAFHMEVQGLADPCLPNEPTFGVVVVGPDSKNPALWNFMMQLQTNMETIIGNAIVRNSLQDAVKSYGNGRGNTPKFSLVDGGHDTMLAHIRFMDGASRRTRKAKTAFFEEVKTRIEALLPVLKKTIADDTALQPDPTNSEHVRDATARYNNQVDENAYRLADKIKKLREQQDNNQGGLISP